VEIKDSGARREFDSGMVRDTTDGKTDYLSCRWGPMFKRWNVHLTKGRKKYPDVELGVPNWTLAQGEAEYMRFRESASRHFEAWLDGETDEDHAAGVFFNINGAEYVKDKMDFESSTDADAAVISQDVQDSFAQYRRSCYDVPVGDIRPFPKKVPADRPVTV
jgi:hypothetical protein